MVDWGIQPAAGWRGAAAAPLSVTLSAALWDACGGKEEVAVSQFEKCGSWREFSVFSASSGGVCHYSAVGAQSVELAYSRVVHTDSHSPKQTREDIPASPTLWDWVWPRQTCQTNQSSTKKNLAFVHFFQFAVQGGRDGGSWQEEISIGVRLRYSPSELNSSWTHYLFVLTINGPLCCSLTQFPPIYIRRIDERRLTDLLKIYKKQPFPSCAVDVSVSSLHCNTAHSTLDRVGGGLGSCLRSAARHFTTFFRPLEGEEHFIMFRLWQRHSRRHVWGVFPHMGASSIVNHRATTQEGWYVA